MDEGKTCKYCLTFKPYTEFRRAKKCFKGYRGKCKDCERPTRNSHYTRNKEKYHQAYQEFLLRNPNYQKEYYLKRKALPN